MKIKIRKGTIEDLPRLRELVVELAVFEKEPDAVEVTLEELQNDGFGTHPIFGFFVAEVNDTIQGIALHYFKYSTWKGKCLFLEDIVVNENFRNQGIGKLLFDEIVKLAAANKCKRLEWQVLQWNESAIRFYQNKYDAEINGEWFNGQLNAEKINEIATKLQS